MFLYFRRPSKDKFQTPPEKSVKKCKKVFKINESQSEEASVEDGIYYILMI